MNERLEPGGIARRLLLRRALGAGAVALIAGTARVAVAADPQIIIDNFTFAPTPLTIKVSTNVTWANHDDIPHSILCPKLNIKSHAMDTDDTFSFKFEQVGTFDYMCGIHPHMHGQVVVEA